MRKAFALIMTVLVMLSIAAAIPVLANSGNSDSGSDGTAGSGSNNLKIYRDNPYQFYAEFEDASRNSARIPVAYAAGGVKLGDSDDDLILDKSMTISKNDYFVLSAGGKSYALRYISALGSGESSPKIKFLDISNYGGEVDVPYNAKPGEPFVGTPDAVISIGGNNFNVWNVSDDTKANFELRIDLGEDNTLYSSDKKFDIIPSGDSQLYLSFTVGSGESARIPIAYSASGYVKLGDIDDDLIIDKSKTISRNDYLVLGKGKKWNYALRYISALPSTETDPKLEFQNLGTGGRIGVPYNAKLGEPFTGIPDARIVFGNNAIYNVWNASVDTSSNFDIRVDLEGQPAFSIQPIKTPTSGGGGSPAPIPVQPTPIPAPPGYGGGGGLAVVFPKLDESFTLEKGQTAILTDYRSMHVELRNLESKFCAAVVGQECPGPVATVEISVSEPVFRTQSSSGSASASGGVVATASRATAAIAPAKLLTGILSEGETAKYEVNGKWYEVTLNFVGPTAAKFTVNDEVTSTLLEGETYTLKDSAQITLNDLLKQDSAGGARKAKFTLSVAVGGGGMPIVKPWPVSKVILQLSDGQSATAFDATVTALDVSYGKATFVVSKKVYVSDVVDVGITPRVVNVGQGSVATYTVTVQDKHPGIVCKPGQICPQALPGYIYSIEVIGLPFETSYVKNFAVEAGGKKDFVLTVDTSRTPPFEGPAPDEEVDTAVAQAKATATTEAILPVTGRASAPSADIVRKCLNTGDNYEMCVVKEGRSVSATTTATIAATAVAKASAPKLGIPEKPVPRLTTTYPTTYRFAVRVSREGGPVNEGAVDVAYATLNIQPKEPTGPPSEGRLLPPCGKYGDVDQDGYVSVKDANLISNYTVGNIQLTDIQKKNAEVTADGVVDVGDALFIAQYVKGLRSTFPVCGSEIIVVPPPIEVQPVEKISISLERGWNLVSLPGKVVTFLPSDCTKNRKLLGFIYLSEQGKYVSLQEARRQLGSEFSEYLSQHAFWVYSYNGCTFEANVKTYVSYDELSLQPGWNLIPITPAMVGKNLNELNVNCDFSKLYKWSAEQQKWNILTQDYAFTEADLNKGFIAKTDNYCELGGELTISPPDWPE